jgi:hypothetical protein
MCFYILYVFAHYINFVSTDWLVMHAIRFKSLLAFLDLLNCIL